MKNKILALSVLITSFSLASCEEEEKSKNDIQSKSPLTNLAGTWSTLKSNFINTPSYLPSSRSEFEKVDGNITISEEGNLTFNNDLDNNKLLKWLLPLSNKEAPEILVEKENIAKFSINNTDDKWQLLPSKLTFMDPKYYTHNFKVHDLHNTQIEGINKFKEGAKCIEFISVVIPTNYVIDKTLTPSSSTTTSDDKLSDDELSDEKWSFYTLSPSTTPPVNVNETNYLAVKNGTIGDIPLKQNNEINSIFTDYIMNSQSTHSNTNNVVGSVEKCDLYNKTAISNIKEIIISN